MRFSIRLIAGSWCFLAFVFVHAYQSVLISYILAPGMESPIIDSLTDLVNKTDVQLLVEKGMPIDAFLTVIFCSYQKFLTKNHVYCRAMRIHVHQTCLKKQLPLKKSINPLVKDWTNTPNRVATHSNDASI